MVMTSDVRQGRLDENSCISWLKKNRQEAIKMEELTRKRTKALVIDSVIAAAAGGVLSHLWRKRTGKTGFMSEVAIPQLTMWGLELLQMKRRGRTIGHDVAGIRIQSEDGEVPDTLQLMKRMLHRETVSQLILLTRRGEYQAYKGTRFPHDTFANTVVKAVDKR